ncbi:MAG: sugar phosphate isomerase/epimerase [Kiritimatiellae bacterium]|nr:sugar phosphate isomerase/epimerase [Kiritimatiellia bacterium]
MNRMEFLKLGLGAGAFAAGCRTPLFGGRPVALQLWSINKIIWKEDPAKTFADLKSLGYDGVEFAGFGGRKAKEIGKLLRDAGLRGMGAHICGEGTFDAKLKENLDFCAEAGIESVTNSWADYDNPDDWKRFGAMMGRAAEAAEAWRLPVGVHNHCHEFKKVYNGVYAWDLIFSEASVKLRQQIDTSQVVNPGLDVVERLAKYRGRNYSVHMKENVPSEWGFFGVPPSDGGGAVDWPGVVAYLEDEPGFTWYVVECERRPDSLKPARYNLEYLRRLI